MARGGSQSAKRRRTKKTLAKLAIGFLARQLASTPARQRRCPAPRALRAGRLGVGSVGALAIGALSVGAAAVGALAIGRLAIKRGAIGSLRIEELKVGKLEVQELTVLSDSRTQREP